MEFLKDKEVIEVCPEVEGGLSVPRPRVEIRDGKAVNEFEQDVDAQFRKGVSIVMKRIENQEIDLAVLQSRSPTCGVHQIYDGSFTGTLIDGQGFLAEELINAGYKVIDVEEL